jgi:hypothetical protein
MGVDRSLHSGVDRPQAKLPTRGLCEPGSSIPKCETCLKSDGHAKGDSTEPYIFHFTRAQNLLAIPILCR